MLCFFLVVFIYFFLAHGVEGRQHRAQLWETHSVRYIATYKTKVIVSRASSIL